MSMDLVDFKRNNWGLYIFIAIVVLVIIFLPDLIGGKKEKPVNEVEQSEVKKESQPVQEEEVVEEEVEVYVDPLTIKGDKEDTPVVVEERREVIVRSEEENEDTKNNNVSEEQSSISQVTPQPLLKLNSISWQNLHDGAVVDELRQLRARAERLAASMPSIFEDSRYSLYNFISGIDYLLGNNDRKMSALNAILYLEYLDKEVTKTFIREQVSRGYFVEWAHISLSTLLGKNSAETFKLMAQPDFNPAILLTSVEAEVPLMRERNYTPPISRISNFKFKGIVVGNDVVDVEVFRNGDSVKKFNVRRVEKNRNIRDGDSKKINLNLLRKEDNNKNQRQGTVNQTKSSSDDVFEFEIDRSKVDGFYAIKVTNIEGFSSVKTYKFDNIFSVRRWKIDNEKNRITFSYKNTSKYPTRVDEAFSIVKKNHSSSDGFVVGGDNSGFKSY